MEEQKKYELFDRYLRGELEQEELDDFLERLESDQELKNEFAMYQYLVEGIREHEKQELKAFLSKKRNEEIRYIGNPWSKRFTYASAAILVGFGLLYVVLDNRVKDNNIVVNEPVIVPETPETPAIKEGAEEVERIKPKDEVAIVPELKPESPEMEIDTSLTRRRGTNPGIKGDDGGEFPVMGDPNRMASSSSDEYPVKEDSRIMDTVITLAIQFEQETGMVLDTGAGKIHQTITVDAPEKILVQFWESPINYKGYRFDGRKLVLFGLDTFEQVELKYRVIDANLKVYDVYLVYGKLHVKLIDNNRYNAYIRETNPAILNELK
ncbi:MAG TPA: hypothetical protein DIW47_05100 [Bacteroidetes bacterium]|nr:hypothetical protein [Bacteroidota bacterium]